MFKKYLLSSVLRSAGEAGSDEPSFQDILQFDPFDNAGGDEGADNSDSQPDQSAQGSDDNQGQQSGDDGQDAPGSQQSGQEGTTPPQPGTGQNAQPGASPPPSGLSAADLERMIAQQTEALSRTLAPRQPAQQPQQNEPKFKLGVPDALANALRSEDPQEFRNGVGAMINGVANHVWNTFEQHLTENVLPNLPRMIENYVSGVRQQEQVATDFYGKYPQLNIPEMKPMVQTIGAQIAREFQAAGKPLGWGNEIRDAIAERIFQRLPFLRNVPAQQQDQNAGRRQNGNGRRPYSANNGARPTNNDGQTEEQRDMTAMIFGGR